MLTVDEALKLILAHAAALPPRDIERSASLGLVLAEEIASDLDSPPFDRSTVDGYAVRAGDLPGGTGELRVLEEVVAGDMPTQEIVAGTATRIMTGAPLPVGADSVVMFERTELIVAAGAAERVLIRDPRLAAGQSIVRQGSATRRGESVLERGHLLRGIEIGLLAEVGRGSVLAWPQPRVVVLSTGNELVPPDETPRLSQIRGSVGPMLSACAVECGVPAIDAGIVRDDRHDLRLRISSALELADVLLLSGGVSAGTLDLVPGVLVELGVREVFHKVQVKPGKPLWFGVVEHAAGRRLVFGLPGNPVSSYVCFQLFVRPALASLAQREDLGFTAATARLELAHAHRGDRPAYRPAHICRNSAGATVKCIEWQGSGDLAGLAKANALAYFPAGDRDYRAGESVTIYSIGEVRR